MAFLGRREPFKPIIKQGLLRYPLPTNPIGKSVLVLSVSRDRAAQRPVHHYQPYIRRSLPGNVAPQGPIGKMVLVTRVSRDRATKPNHRYPIIEKTLIRYAVASNPIGKQVMATRVSRDRAAKPPVHHYHATYLTFKPSGVQVIRWWIKT